MDHRAIPRYRLRQCRGPRGWPRKLRHQRIGTRPSIRAQDGQATAEFAIVATVMLLIVIGILYFGRLLNYTIQATHLANEAARDAAVDVNPGAGASLSATLVGQIGGELKNGSHDVTSPISAVTFCFPNGTSSPGTDPVRAIVTFKFHFLPFLGVGTVTVTQTATMLLEEPQNTSVYAVAASCPA